jgi:hypothetical protein
MPVISAILGPTPCRIPPLPEVPTKCRQFQSTCAPEDPSRASFIAKYRGECLMAAATMLLVFFRRLDDVRVTCPDALRRASVVPARDSRDSIS